MNLRVEILIYTILNLWWLPKHLRDICQLSFWSCINHKFSWSSFAQSNESTSCILSGGSSLAKLPRLVRDEEMTGFPTPTRDFFGFLDSPTSKNFKNRLTRFGPNQDSEPFLRLRGTSNMVSRRLKNKWEMQINVRFLSTDNRIWITNDAQINSHTNLDTITFLLLPPSGQTKFWVLWFH